MTEIDEKIYIFRIGVPKSIVYSLLTAMVIGVVTLSFAFIKTTGQTNEDLPIESKKIQTTNDKVDKLSIKVEVMENDMSNVKESVNDINSKIDKVQELIIQQLTISKQINNNTK